MLMHANSDLVYGLHMGPSTSRTDYIVDNIIYAYYFLGRNNKRMFIMKTEEEIKKEIERCYNEYHRLYTPPVSFCADGARTLLKRAKVLEWVLKKENK